MLKRVTLLKRRPDLSPETFSTYWRTDHAAIAVDLPGLLCYRQNHVVETIALPDDGAAYDVDGLVELWFTGAADARAGLSSKVTDRLVEDEPRFLAGLTGGTMTAPPPGDFSAAAVWVLGCWSEAPDPAAVRTWAHEDAADVELHVLDENEPLLLRERLRREPEMPQVLLRYPAPDTATAQATADRVVARLGSRTLSARRIQVLVATVTSIVEPETSRQTTHQ